MALTRLHETDVARGILCIVIAMALFTIQDAIAKVLVEAGVSIWQVTFCRALFGLIPMVPLIHARKAWDALRMRRPRDHLLRGVIVVASLLCFFHGLRAIPLADAYALSFSAPLFMTALSMPLLGERVGWHRWSAVGVGFVGVLVMIQPGSGLFQPAALIILLSAVLYAFSVILVRGLSATEPPLTIVFYFCLGGALMTAPALPFVGVWPADATMAGLMLAIGMVGGMAQLFLTLAYARAPVAVIAPFDYTALVWAGLAGWLVFGDVPEPVVMAGAGLVIAGGIYIVRREARLQLGVPGARRPTEAV